MKNQCLRYAGPGTQVAKHEWKQGWASYLSSSRGWIVAQIDGRGSGGEGDRRRFEIWHQVRIRFEKHSFFVVVEQSMNHLHSIEKKHQKHSTSPKKCLSKTRLELFTQIN